MLILLLACSAPSPAPPDLPTARTRAWTGPQTQAIPVPTAQAAVQTPAPKGSLRHVPSADLGPRDQLALERLNRVRADPRRAFPEWKAYLKREIKENSSQCSEGMEILKGLKESEPRMPLAANQALTDAARLHARDLVDRAYFAHISPEGIGPNKRVRDAGYPLPVGKPLVKSATGYYVYSADDDGNQIEALFQRLTSATFAQDFEDPQWADAIDALIVDRCVPSRGHRKHLLAYEGVSPIEREVGVGSVAEAKQDGPRQFTSAFKMAIETGVRDDDVFYVLGVVYDDTDGDGLFDVGEQKPGVRVEIPSAGIYTETAAGGGFALPVKKGSSGTVTVNGKEQPFTIGDANVKVDFSSP